MREVYAVKTCPALHTKFDFCIEFTYSLFSISNKKAKFSSNEKKFGGN